MNEVPTDGPIGPDSETPKAPSRSGATNWLLAGILVVLVAIAAVLVLNNTDSSDTASAEPGAPTSTTVAETTTTTEASTTTEAETTTTIAETTTTTEASTTTEAETTTTTVRELTDEIAAKAAMDWIDALAAGDVDTAFDLVAPESQSAFGGRAGFDGSFSGLVEGFGARADASGRRTG